MAETSYAWGKINDCIKRNRQKINEHAENAVYAYYYPENSSQSFYSWCTNIITDIADPIISLSIVSSYCYQEAFLNFIAYLTNKLLDKSSDNFVLKFICDPKGFTNALLCYCGSFYENILNGKECGCKEHTVYDDIPEPKRNAIFHLKYAFKELNIAETSNYWKLSLNDREKVIKWINKNVPSNKTLEIKEFEHYLALCDNANVPYSSGGKTDRENKRDTEIPDIINKDPSKRISLHDTTLVEDLNTIKTAILEKQKGKYKEEKANNKFNIFMVYLLHEGGYSTQTLSDALDDFIELGKCIKWAGSIDFEASYDSLMNKYKRKATIEQFGDCFSVNMKNYSYTINSTFELIETTPNISRYIKNLFALIKPKNEHRD